jgi:O-antigen/teichoic acid export membrane protein
MTVERTPDQGGDRHGETVAQRHDRNLSDLLQELRVAGLGVQVLFGFLLSLPFTARFVRLNGTQRDLYLCSLLLAALSIALLVAPVAFHRWVFQMHEKGRLLRASNVMALAGLATVSLSISAAVLLVLSFVAAGVMVSILIAGVVFAFAILWFALPLYERRRPTNEWDS